MKNYLFKNFTHAKYKFSCERKVVVFASARKKFSNFGDFFPIFVYVKNFFAYETEGT